MRQDDVLMNKVIEEAGLLSRTAARAKALGGAAKQAVGDVATAISGKKPASDAGWRGKYTQGKQEQILKTLSNDIIKDLTKLKLVPADSPLNPSDLQNTLTQYISKYTGVGGGDQQQMTPQAQAETLQSTPTPQAAPTPKTTPEQQTPTPAPQAAPQPETAPTPTPQTTPETKIEEPKQEETSKQNIPLGSIISGKIGNKPVTYRYSSPEEVSEDNKLTPNPNASTENAKWYSLSKPSKKTGQPSMAFDDVLDQNIQSSISSAWQKQNAKEQEQQKKASTPTFESFKNYFWK